MSDTDDCHLIVRGCGADLQAHLRLAVDCGALPVVANEPAAVLHETHVIVRPRVCVLTRLASAWRATASARDRAE